MQGNAHACCAGQKESYAVDDTQRNLELLAYQQAHQKDWAGRRQTCGTLADYLEEKGCYKDACLWRMHSQPKAVTGWANISRWVIAYCMEHLPPTATVQQKRKALREFFPFGERKNHPYKIWLKCVKEEFRKDASVRAAEWATFWATSPLFGDK